VTGENLPGSCRTGWPSRPWHYEQAGRRPSLSLASGRGLWGGTCGEYDLSVVFDALSSLHGRRDPQFSGLGITPNMFSKSCLCKRV
jgi:hypothetical protein